MPQVLARGRAEGGLDMRQTRVVAAALVGLSVVAGVAIAPEVPNWDWQTTFVFNSSGAITSSNLDASSSYWLDCTLALVQISNTDTSTSNTTHMERVLIDTTNKLTGYIVQNNSNINEKRWSCVGAQVQVTNDAGEADYSCSLTGVGIAPCFFDCAANNKTRVNNYQGWSPLTNGKLSADCGAADPSCDVHTTTTCSDSDDTGPLSDAGTCQAAIGVYADTGCSSDH